VTRIDSRRVRWQSPGGPRPVNLMRDAAQRSEGAVAARPAPGRAAPVRVVIEGVAPEIDGGRFPAKRSLGETVTVAADVFAEGHDRLAAVLRHRHVDEDEWHETPMAVGENDRWTATFRVTRLGVYEYVVHAWVDAFASWRAGLAKKHDAGLDVANELLEGAALVAAAAARARGRERDWLAAQADLIGGDAPASPRIAAALAAELAAAIARHPDRSRETRLGRTLRVVVDPERATYGAWYEMFARSVGTFADVIARLPYVASMGFDVLYLPPIHPIGRTHRKGRNNAPRAAEGDPGSPWAIGGPEGGHDAVHPALGTLADFDRLVAAARDHGLEIALDLAFQCSPDHPWVQEHPGWFRRRPDGTIQHAENPPKKYEDIYPLDFECDDWRALWEELRRVVLFWVARGVRIFRVDNPHTKPFAFWEWLIAEVRAAHPDVFFLAEAFTRPKVMRYLAKLGFSQSYTYFTWRNTKDEITRYLTELTATEVRDYLRPNLFANTPDILPEYLQFGGRAAFQIRLVLAATLGATYGIYGPPFERCEAAALPGTEEYRDAEKYEVRRWDVDRPGTLRDFIARVNQIRRENPALRANDRLRFCPVDNDRLIAYVKTTPDRANQILVIVTLDPHHRQSGWVDVPLDELGVDAAEPYQVHDLLGDARYLWHGARSFVALDPGSAPAHVFVVRRRVRTERDFDYFF
jgi:starch synthase (maltosyl-transferring)